MELFKQSNPMSLNQFKSITGKWIIYLMTCRTTGFHYVGCTKDLKKRLKQHERVAQTRKSRYYNLPIAKAIRKYGFEDFDIFVLDSDDDHKFAKDVMERGYVEMYDAYRNGYNTTKGGIGSLGYKYVFYNNGIRMRRFEEGKQPKGYHRGFGGLRVFKKAA